MTAVGYYVTVRDAGRTGLLLGPYDTHAAALDNVDRARRAAVDADPWAHFYAYGTSKATGAPLRLGRLNNRIGLHADRSTR